MNFRKTLTAAFVTALAIGAAGCGPSGPRQTPEQEKANTVSTLEKSDKSIFSQAGFEVVARTGMGQCNNNGEIIYPSYSGNNTDFAYILKKSSTDNLTYTACAVHSSSGETSIVGLRAVEKLAVPVLGK